MLLVADVHGEFGALADVARRGEPLLVLGDLLNFIDYRTNDGLLADVTSRGFVAELSALRNAGRIAESRRLWADYHRGREDELGARFGSLIRDSYRSAAAALDGAEAYVTYGNADRPDLLRECLPSSAVFLDGEVVEIEGRTVGFVGGGMEGIGVPGEVSEDGIAEKLAQVEGVDVLCTHVAPAVPALSSDVIGGRVKHSEAVLEFIAQHRPARHYFGDIHQPQALTWRVGPTICQNVGYFRATRRAVRGT